MKTIGNYTLLLTIMLCILSSSLDAKAPYVIQKFRVEARIDKAGNINFTEIIDVEFFEKRRGIIRDIPLNAKLLTDKRRLSLTKVSVKDRTYSIDEKEHEISIKIGDKAKNLIGRHQYIINYTAIRGILNFKDHEEFFWTLIGTEWDAEIRKAEFMIHIHPEIDITEDEIKIYAGKKEATTAFATYELKGRKIEGEALSILGKGKGLTLVFKAPKGSFYNDKDRLTKLASHSKVKDFFFPIPIAILIALLASFFKFGRRKEETSSLTEMYYPPEDMTPSEVGTFHDYIVNHRDIVALIPYWGTKGLIKVRATENGNDTDLYLEKISDIPENAKPHEKYFFDKLFEVADIVFINELKDEFYQEYNETKKLLKKDALEERLYDQDAKKYFHGFGIVAFGIIFFILGLFMIIGIKAIPTGVILILLAITCLVIRFLQPKKSDLGSRLHKELESLRLTLQNPDDTRLQNILQKDQLYFEKVLPYAVAFGMDKEWNNKFETLGQKTPEWYYSNAGPVFFSDFNDGFQTNEISRTISSVPVTDSGSSGMGGGGSVGGGFGGGGGSSW